MNKIKSFFNTLKLKSLDFSIFIVLITLTIILIILNSEYRDINNYMNIFWEASFLGVAALGMTCMIIIGETDLSIGAMMAVISIITFLIMPYVGIWTAILIALIIGILLGMLNGFFVVYLKIFSFILTLGMQFVYKGFAYILTNQQVLQVPVKEYTKIGNMNLFASGSFDGIPLPFIIFIACAVVFYILLNKTAFCRKIFAIGNSEKASVIAGIRVKRVKFVVYMIMGLFTAVATIMNSSRLCLASAEMRPLYEFDVIIIVVMGGCVFRTGRGSIINTFISSIFFTMIYNIINNFNVDPYLQYIIRAVLIIMAFSVSNIKAFVGQRIDKYKYNKQLQTNN